MIFVVSLLKVPMYSTYIVATKQEEISIVVLFLDKNNAIQNLIGNSLLVSDIEMIWLLDFLSIGSTAVRLQWHV